MKDIKKTRIKFDKNNRYKTQNFLLLNDICPIKCWNLEFNNKKHYLNKISTSFVELYFKYDRI